MDILYKINTDDAILVIQLQNTREYWFSFGEAYICFEADDFGNYLPKMVSHELKWVDDEFYDILINKIEE